MITHRGFSAWVMAEGRPLPEYLVAVDTSANKVSCWIPSESGKNFSVHWKDEGSQVDSCAFIYLDGLVAPGRFLSGYGEAWRGGIRTGHQVERPFVFAERTNASTGTVHRDDGTIALKIRLIRMGSRKRADPLQHLPESVESQSDMLTHYISYGKEKNTYERYPCTWEVASYDRSGNRSYVTFVFRYRPREFLLAQGIMTTDAPRGPPARDVGATTRQMVGASTNFMISSAAPSPYAHNRAKQGPASQWAFVPWRDQPALHFRYPGRGGILDLGLTAGSGTMETQGP